MRKLIDRQGEQLLEEATAELLRSGDISRHSKTTPKVYHAHLEPAGCFVNSWENI